MENLVTFVQNQIDKLILEQIEERDIVRSMWLEGQIDAYLDVFNFAQIKIEIESYNG